MRFLVLTADYRSFLDDLYETNPGLADKPYADQLNLRRATRFGLAEPYAHYLTKAGHDAAEIYVNNARMQNAWDRDSPDGHQSRRPSTLKGQVQKAMRAIGRTPLRSLRPLVGGFVRQSSLLSGNEYATLRNQIRRIRPDVILNQAVDTVPATMIRRSVAAGTLLVGQLAAPPPPDHEIQQYDALFSSLPNLVERFRSLGITSVHHPFGADPRLLDEVGPRRHDHLVTFVGSVSAAHRARTGILEAVASAHPLKVWGPEHQELSSALRPHYKGRAWGLEMYRILRASRMTINQHSSISGSWANNIRLFEATAMGALLVTDVKSNLPDFFEPGHEVVTYVGADDCAQTVAAFVDDGPACERIAGAGQRRVFRDHPLEGRVQEFADACHRLRLGVRTEKNRQAKM